MIPNWNDPLDKISKYFTVKQALYLHKWNRLAVETDGLNDEVKANLLLVFDKLDTIQNIYKNPLLVTSAFRPIKYNEMIHGAPHSEHTLGKAVDFIVIGKSPVDVRMRIKGLLASLELRMEANTPGWIHVDTKEVAPGANRVFNP